jgi:hypothetical protein
MVYTNSSLPGYVNYWGMKSGDWFDGTNWQFDSDEDWSRSSAYPSINKWPAGEWRMNNRWSIPGGEFTMNENLSEALFTYGFLCDSTGSYKPNQRPVVKINQFLKDTLFLPSDSVELSVIASPDVCMVAYYYNWHFIGSSQDHSTGFNFKWKPDIPGGKYLITAKGYDVSGYPTNPSSAAERNLTVVTSEPSGILSSDKPPFRVFPNPSRGGKVFVQLPAHSGKIWVTVFDLNGRRLLQSEAEASIDDIVEINNINMLAGIYLLEIRSNYQKRYQKLVIQE